MSSRLPPQPAFGEPLPVARREDVLRFLALRRSTSAVTLMEPAPSPSEVQDLLRIATRAPDHGKLAPWRFILLEGADKTAFADRLQALAEGRGEAVLVGKLGKLRAPPLAIVVVFRPKPGQIPEWEQVLSAGAVSANLLHGALAMGYGANWITDWYSYDADAKSILGLAPDEHIAAVMLIGTPREAPLERERPDLAPLISRWTPQA